LYAALVAAPAPPFTVQPWSFSTTPLPYATTKSCADGQYSSPPGGGAPVVVSVVGTDGVVGCGSIVVSVVGGT
jgi:hypothetical protein